MQVVSGCGSIFPWWHCNALCTSTGFVDVVISQGGLYGALCIFPSVESIQANFTE